METRQSPDSTEVAATSTETEPASANGVVPRPRRFSTRGFTSLLLTLSLLVVSFSGVVLYVTPRGRVANWTDWTLFGLGKEQWAALHMNGSILFLVAAVLHLALNWSILCGYVKKKAVAGLHMKRELALATAIAVVCVAGTLYSLPPFSSVLALNHDIKDYWEQPTTRAPVPHAEEFTLEEFATHVNLPVDDLTEALNQEGFNADDVHLTVGQLGRQKGVAPSAVFAAVRKHYPEAGAMTGRGPGWGRGQGFGQRGGMQSTTEHPGDLSGAEAGSDGPEGRNSLSNAGCSAGDAERHGNGLGPGGGRGFGPGQGRGMGMGMGMSRGRGRRLSQGGDEEHGQPSADE